MPRSLIRHDISGSYLQLRHSLQTQSTGTLKYEEFDHKHFKTLTFYGIVSVNNYNLTITVLWW